jgi:hypothetical protein
MHTVDAAESPEIQEYELAVKLIEFNGPGGINPRISAGKRLNRQAFGEDG